jgi:hypothetical protein
LRGGKNLRILYFDSTRTFFMKGAASFPEVKPPERGVDYQPPSSAEVKERVELYLYSTTGLPWPVLE